MLGLDKKDIVAISGLFKEIQAIENSALSKLIRKVVEARGGDPAGRLTTIPELFPETTDEDHERQRQELMAEGFPRCLAHLMGILEAQSKSRNAKEVAGDLEAIQMYHAYTLPRDLKR